MLFVIHTWEVNDIKTIHNPIQVVQQWNSCPGFLKCANSCLHKENEDEIKYMLGGSMHSLQQLHTCM